MNSSHTTAASGAASGGVGAGENVIAQSNDASPAETSGVRKHNLPHLISSIHKTLAILDELYRSVSSFELASKFSHLKLLNDLVLELDNMTRLADNCSIPVPVKVVNLIDEGKNPDIFTRDLLNECIAKNQIVKGKTDVFKCLRLQLRWELDKAFPHEVNVYRDIRRASAVEARQSMQLHGELKELIRLRRLVDETS